MMDMETQRAERQARRAEHHAKTDAAVQPILDDLKLLGIEVSSIHELIRQHAPLSSEVAKLLLRWLPKVRHHNVLDMIVRALGATKDPFDGRPLTELFDMTKDDRIRWPIANTLECGKPLNVADWIVNKIRTNTAGHAEQMLVLALIRHVPRETAIPLLRDALGRQTGHVVMALGKVGGQDEIPLIEAMKDHKQKWVNKEIDRAVRRIKRRQK